MAAGLLCDAFAVMVAVEAVAALVPASVGAKSRAGVLLKEERE